MSIVIRIASQALELQSQYGDLLKSYSISSAKNGIGEKKGSYQTPRGKHIICEKIGGGMPIYTVFQARKPTGEIYSEVLAKQFPERDWILSRILWLSGTELGVNAGGDVDTKNRFIYIHGTHDEKNIGTPQSHGCIRMKNADVIDLFDRVAIGETVSVCE